MQALVFHGDRQLELREVPVPVPQSGEVLVRVAATGICGSDLYDFRTQPKADGPGRVMGHEIGGTVESTGEVVAVNPLVSCGRCRACLAGDIAHCADHHVLEGGFAELLCVPRKNAIPFPGNSAEDAALVEPLAVALHVAARLQIGRQDSLAIVGGGPIGLLCMLAARRAGVRQLYVFEADPYRRAKADVLGGTAFGPVDTQAIEDLRGATGGGVSVAIDTVGASSTLQGALELTVIGGTVGLVGVSKRFVEFDLEAALASERRMIPSFCYSRQQFDEAVALVASGEIAASSIIDHRVGFAEAVDAFDALATGQARATKVVLAPVAA